MGVKNVHLFQCGHPVEVIGMPALAQGMKMSSIVAGDGRCHEITRAGTTQNSYITYMRVLSTVYREMFVQKFRVCHQPQK